MIPGGAVFTASPEYADLWNLRCRHGRATSDEVAALMAPSEIAETFKYWAARMPEETSDSIVALIALRMLLGRLLERRYGCRCGIVPWPPEVPPAAKRGGRPS